MEAPISVSLESTLLTYDAKTLEDLSSGRSLDWDPRNSEVTYNIQDSSKDILGDEGQGSGNKSKIAKYNKTLTITNHPTRDLLMIYKVEATGKPTQLTYEKATWNYNTNKQSYELIATFNIGFPEGIGSLGHLILQRPRSEVREAEDLRLLSTERSQTRDSCVRIGAVTTRAACERSLEDATTDITIVEVDEVAWA